MASFFRERRCVYQSASPERGPDPVVPPEGDAATAEARAKMNVGPDFSGIDNPFLRFTNLFSSVTHLFRPLFQQYPEPMQQQLWPQMQGIYGGMMTNMQQNYYGMLYNVQNYPGMSGAWPGGVFDTAGMYPYSGQSYAYPTPWTWYAPPGTVPVPGIQPPPGYRPPYAPPGYVPPATSEANSEHAQLLQNARTALSSLTLRNPQLGVLLDDRTLTVTVQLAGRGQNISLSGQRPETVAKYLEDQVAAFLRGASSAPPEGPSDAISGVPDTITANTPFTLTLRPPTASLAIMEGERPAARPYYIINERGMVSPAGGAPFTVTRTGGSLRITITAPGTYAFRSGAQAVRRTVTASAASSEQARFEAMVRGVALPTGVTVTAVAGRDVTLTFDGLTRVVAVGAALTTATLVAAFLTLSSRELQRRRAFEKAWDRVAPYSVEYTTYSNARISKAGVTRTVLIPLAPAGAGPDAGADLEATYRKQIGEAIAKLDALETPAELERAIASAVQHAHRSAPYGIEFSATGTRIRMAQGRMEEWVDCASKTPQNVGAFIETACAEFNAGKNARTCLLNTKKYVVPPGVEWRLSHRRARLYLTLTYTDTRNSQETDITDLSPFRELEAIVRRFVVTEEEKHSSRAEALKRLINIKLTAISHVDTLGTYDNPDPEEFINEHVPRMLDSHDVGDPGINQAIAELRTLQPFAVIPIPQIRFQKFPTHSIQWNEQYAELVLIRPPFADPRSPYARYVASYSTSDAGAAEVDSRVAEGIVPLHGRRDGEYVFVVGPGTRDLRHVYFEVPVRGGAKERWVIWQMDSKGTGFNRLILVRARADGSLDARHSGFIEVNSVFERSYDKNGRPLQTGVRMRDGWGKSLAQQLQRIRDEAESEERDAAKMRGFDLDRGPGTRVAVLNFVQEHPEGDGMLETHKDYLVALRARGYPAFPRRGIRTDANGIPIGQDGKPLSDMAIRVTDNPPDVIRRHIKEAVDDGATSVLMTMVAHGSGRIAFRKADGTGYLYITYSELMGIFKEFPTTKFTLIGVFCYGAWGSDHSRFQEIMRDEGVEGRITIITMTKPYATNSNDTTFDRRLIAGLFAGESFGQAFQEADLAHRSASQGVSNPEVRRSGRTPTYTAGARSADPGAGRA